MSDNSQVRKITQTEDRQLEPIGDTVEIVQESSFEITTSSTSLAVSKYTTMTGYNSK